MADSPPSNPAERSAILESWLRDHADALWAFAISRAPREHTEDLIQETLLAALASANSFESRSSPRTWLIGILNHKIIDFYRARSRNKAQSFDPAQHDAAPQGWTADFNARGKWTNPPASWSANPDSALLKDLAHCVDELPALLKDAISLRDLRQLPADAVCQVLDISPTNLWTRLHRARTAVRRCIESRLHARKEETPQ
jgi:RNA polymerase sigma-70 factor (ECF subfamily)